MEFNYSKTLAHGYTYWTIQVNGHTYKENGHKKLFSTKKDAEFYTFNPVQRGTEVQVNGLHFQVWSDFGYRCTFACCLETGEAKTIHSSGYIHKDLTIRKAIAIHFQLPTFKTETPKAEATTRAKKEKTPEQKAKAAARRRARKAAKVLAQAREIAQRPSTQKDF